MRRLVDVALAISKELMKTFMYEFLNNTVRLINGVSSLFLAIVLGKANILEGVQGWELRPTFHGPRFPHWMENGVSSFNQLIHELSVDSDTSSIDYSSEENDLDETNPASPSSYGSRTSRTSFAINHSCHWTDWMAYIFSLILLPVRIFLWMPFLLFRLLNIWGSRASSDSESPRARNFHSFMKAHNSKDHVVKRSIDRRRGVVEDLHLSIEIFIEAIFDMIHKTAHFVLSPSLAFRIFVKWFTSASSDVKDVDEDVLNASVPPNTVGDKDPAPTERNPTLHHALNTDARTCKDIITELGYPYEAIHVITADGYILLLERIPRRDARKAVYLQHGIFDSSVGWVSEGIVGSPAFAAYDQGYDVFLGNLRGLVSREHVDKKISSRKYWWYTVNEHGTKDIPAMIEKIHEIKTAELKIIQPDEETNDEQPYKLGAMAHSLGGAVMLMYLVMRLIERKPHKLSRMILLSPAGFHQETIFILTVAHYFLVPLGRIIAYFVPALYIPTWFFRMLFNKLARDFHNYPALGGLIQTVLSYMLGGDSSDWVGVMGLPHYNMDDMPGLSLGVVHHLAQMKWKGKFVMYDYGSTSANMKVYGSSEPIDLGGNYSLIDIPIDLIAGRNDKIISAAMVRRHYKSMRDAGVDVSYKELEYGHLDFTKSNREDILAYVMSRLMLEEPALKHQSSPKKALKLKKKGQASS
ncbi:STOMATAL CYTOKINESIS-DEFECTIVE 1 family protein [Hibiscus syriacus]|uniref:STOMATAL CYTOKINESIS-DEFECTIVE 1 family protein n=1 Tax=Hibiscus syriacus TaxID=106335 RepID=A0A6A3CCS2_HIBSY|nr:lipase 1-like [Hibiscus syriacus]KAE8724982.1 STOMATAL CYTOKINESIS-DEFECTIVE 1 family protein [Hibiscus syriacus]